MVGKEPLDMRIVLISACPNVAAIDELAKCYKGSTDGALPPWHATLHPTARCSMAKGGG